MPCVDGIMIPLVRFHEALHGANSRFIQKLKGNRFGGLGFSVAHQSGHVSQSQTLLLDTPLTAEQRRSAEIAYSSGDGLLKLLNGILDYSKLEAGSVTLESIPFEPAGLAQTVTRLFAAQARDKGLEVVADVGADVPEVLRGDPSRLRQVLTNLVSNAVKFTDEGEVRLAIESVRREGESVVLTFRVSDTGIGIPDDKIETVFDEFRQADTSTARQYGGTGLGLTIARRLVDLMGGELTASSKVGV